MWFLIRIIFQLNTNSYVNFDYFVLMFESIVFTRLEDKISFEFYLS